MADLVTAWGGTRTIRNPPPQSPETVDGVPDVSLVAGADCFGGMAHEQLCVGHDARAGRDWEHAGNVGGRTGAGVCGHSVAVGGEHRVSGVNRDGRVVVPGNSGDRGIGGWLVMAARSVDENCATFAPTVFFADWANPSDDNNSNVDIRTVHNPDMDRRFSVRLCQGDGSNTTICDPQRLSHGRYDTGERGLSTSSMNVTSGSHLVARLDSRYVTCGAHWRNTSTQVWNRNNAPFANRHTMLILKIQEFTPSGNGAFVRVVSVQAATSIVGACRGETQGIPINSLDHFLRCMRVSNTVHGTGERGAFTTDEVSTINAAIPTSSRITTNIDTTSSTVRGKRNVAVGSVYINNSPTSERVLACKDGFRPNATGTDCNQVASADVCRRAICGPHAECEVISREQMYFGTGGVNAPIDNQCWQKMTPDEFKRCVMPPTSGT